MPAAKRMGNRRIGTRRKASPRCDRRSQRPKPCRIRTSCARPSPATRNCRSASGRRGVLAGSVSAAHARNSWPYGTRSCGQPGGDVTADVDTVKPCWIGRATMKAIIAGGGIGGLVARRWRCIAPGSRSRLFESVSRTAPTRRRHQPAAALRPCAGRRWRRLPPLLADGRRSPKEQRLYQPVRPTRVGRAARPRRRLQISADCRSIAACCKCRCWPPPGAQLGDRHASTPGITWRASRQSATVASSRHFIDRRQRDTALGSASRRTC